MFLFKLVEFRGSAKRTLLSELNRILAPIERAIDALRNQYDGFVGQSNLPTIEKFNLIGQKAIEAKKQLVKGDLPSFSSSLKTIETALKAIERDFIHLSENQLFEPDYQNIATALKASKIPIKSNIPDFSKTIGVLVEFVEGATAASNLQKTKTDGFFTDAKEEKGGTSAGADDDEPKYKKKRRKRIQKQKKELKKLKKSHSYKNYMKNQYPGQAPRQVVTLPSGEQVLAPVQEKEQQDTQNKKIDNLYSKILKEGKLPAGITNQQVLELIGKCLYESQEAMELHYENNPEHIKYFSNNELKPYEQRDIDSQKVMNSIVLEKADFILSSFVTDNNLSPVLSKYFKENRAVYESLIEAADPLKTKKLMDRQFTSYDGLVYDIGSYWKLISPSSLADSNLPKTESTLKEDISDFAMRYVLPIVPGLNVLVPLYDTDIAIDESLKTGKLDEIVHAINEAENKGLNTLGYTMFSLILVPESAYVKIAKNMGLVTKTTFMRRLFNELLNIEYELALLENPGITIPKARVVALEKAVKDFGKIMSQKEFSPIVGYERYSNFMKLTEEQFMKLKSTDGLIKTKDILTKNGSPKVQKFLEKWYIENIGPRIKLKPLLKIKNPPRDFTSSVLRTQKPMKNSFTESFKQELYSVKPDQGNVSTELFKQAKLNKQMQTFIIAVSRNVDAGIALELRNTEPMTFADVHNFLNKSQTIREKTIQEVIASVNKPNEYKKTYENIEPYIRQFTSPQILSGVTRLQSFVEANKEIGMNILVAGVVKNERYIQGLIGQDNKELFGMRHVKNFLELYKGYTPGKPRTLSMENAWQSALFLFQAKKLGAPEVDYILHKIAPYLINNDARGLFKLAQNDKLVKIYIKCGSNSIIMRNAEKNASSLTASDYQKFYELCNQNPEMVKSLTTTVFNGFGIRLDAKIPGLYNAKEQLDGFIDKKFTKTHGGTFELYRESESPAVQKVKDYVVKKSGLSKSEVDGAILNKEMKLINDINLSFIAESASDEELQNYAKLLHDLADDFSYLGETEDYKFVSLLNSILENSPNSEATGILENFDEFILEYKGVSDEMDSNPDGYLSNFHSMDASQLEKFIRSHKELSASTILNSIVHSNAVWPDVTKLIDALEMSESFLMKENPQPEFLSSFYEYFVGMPEKREFLQFITEKLSSQPQLLKNLHGSGYSIFMEELMGSEKILHSLKDKQLQKAFSNISMKVARENNEFKLLLMNGEEIPENLRRYMDPLLRKIQGSDFEKNIYAVMNKFGSHFSPKVNSHDIAGAYKDALEMYADALENGLVFDIPKKVVQLKFQVEGVNVSLSESIDVSLRTALLEAKESAAAENYMQMIKQGHDKVLNIFLEGSLEDKKGLMRNLKLDDSLVDKSEEGALRQALKNSELGDMSGMVWDACMRSGNRDIFLTYVQGGKLTKAENTQLLVTLNEFDNFLSEVLDENGLSALLPSVRKSPAYQQIIKARASIIESSQKQQSVTRELRLVFGKNNSLLNTFFGSYSGTCLGDNPGYSLARPDICTATLFQNNEIAGGVLFLMREVEGKPSLIILSVDPSEKVLGNGSTLLSSQKQVELTDWLMEEVYNYASENNLSLYFPKKFSNVGGITNRGATIEKRLKEYRGKKLVKFEPSGDLHETYHYNVSTGIEFKPKDGWIKESLKGNDLNELNFDRGSMSLMEFVPDGKGNCSLYIGLNSKKKRWKILELPESELEAFKEHAISYLEKYENISGDGLIWSLDGLQTSFDSWALENSGKGINDFMDYLISNNLPHQLANQIADINSKLNVVFPESKGLVPQYDFSRTAKRLDGGSVVFEIPLTGEKTTIVKFGDFDELSKEANALESMKLMGLDSDYSIYPFENYSIITVADGMSLGKFYTAESYGKVKLKDIMQGGPKRKAYLESISKCMAYQDAFGLDDTHQNNYLIREDGSLTRIDYEGAGLFHDDLRDFEELFLLKEGPKGINPDEWKLIEASFKQSWGQMRKNFSSKEKELLDLLGEEHLGRIRESLGNSPEKAWEDFSRGVKSQMGGSE